MQVGIELLILLAVASVVLIALLGEHQQRHRGGQRRVMASSVSSITSAKGPQGRVAALEKDVTSWIAHWNENPRPFVWRKTADQILDSLARYCNKLTALNNDSDH